MRTELISAAPVRAALDEIVALESAQRDPTAKQAFADARAILDSAIANAANPAFAEGVDTDTYAQLEGITPDGARKRAKKLIAKGHAEKRGGRYFIFVDRIAS
jgi:hypothetical protein